MTDSWPPLAILALSVISEHPIHAYQLLTTLRGRYGEQRQVVPISPGSVYRSVDKLETAGLVVKVKTEREGNRPERTTFAITDNGHKCLRHHIALFISETDRDSLHFTMGLLLLNDLELDEALALLTERRDTQERQLEEDRRDLQVFLDSGLQRRYVLDYLLRQELLAAEITWIDSLIAAMKDGSVPWHSPHGGQCDNPCDNPGDDSGDNLHD